SGRPHIKCTLTTALGLKPTAFLAGVLLSYWVLLCFPQPFFSSSVEANNLALYSDRSFTPEAGKKILETVGARLAASPLYSARDRHAAFICNAAWRQGLLFNRTYVVGEFTQDASPVRIS